MRIRISERTAVTPDVADFIVNASRQRLDIERLIFNPRHVTDTYRNTAARWLRMAEGQVDSIIGALHGLPYQKIEALPYKDETYLIGRTRPIKMAEYNGDGAKQIDQLWDIGEYLVCIPMSGFVNRTFLKVHLIPLREQLAYARHPHHTSHDYTDHAALNALDRTPKTCSGGFGSIALTLMGQLDFAESMRTWVTFLSRYNRRSPLCGPGSFMQRIVE